MSLICLDTQILIWGIKEEASEGQEELINKSKILIEHLKEKGDKILIPAVILAELLIHVPENAHTAMVNIITKEFFVAPFDQSVAITYARIWQTQKLRNSVQELQALGMTRSEIKADRMIVATAVAHKVERIYSHDLRLRNYAEGFCDAYDIPTIPTQPPLIE